jgi:hypothetical protein
MLFCFTTGILASCDKGNIDSGCKANTSGDTVVFTPGQPLSVFNSCSPDMKATVTKVSDSRCPNHAVCIWAGALSVVIQIDNQFSVTLDQGKQKDTVYLGHQYSFTLIDGKPFPAVNQTVPHDTEISVRIVRY